MSNEYVFKIFDKNYVASLKTNSVIEVVDFGPLFITTIDGETYYIYTSSLFRHRLASNCLWKSTSWKRNCYINILLNGLD